MGKWRSVVSFTFSWLCPREGYLGTHCVGGWVDPRPHLDGPQTPSGCYGEEKNTLSLPGTTEIWFSVVKSVSSLLQWLGYSSSNNTKVPCIPAPRGLPGVNKIGKFTSMSLWQSGLHTSNSIDGDPPQELRKLHIILGRSIAQVARHWLLRADSMWDLWWREMWLLEQFLYPFLIIFPLLFHMRLSPPAEMCDSHDQAAQYHILRIY
jgi:hypothetical protein